MKELLREKTKKVLHQRIKKKHFESMAMVFQTWRHRTTVLKIDHTKNEMSSFITTKLTEINRLKCLRLAEAIKKIHERELRFCLKTIQDHCTENRISTLLKDRQTENAKLLQRMQASYLITDVLQKHLHYQQKKWFLEILDRANKVKRSQQNSDKIMLKSLTSINKNSSSCNPNPVTFNETSKNNSPELSNNQLCRSSNASK